MKYILKTLKQTWEFFSQLSGVVATFGILLYSMNYILTKMVELFKVNLSAFILLTIGVIGSIVFLIYLIKERIFNFITSIKKESLQEDLTHPIVTNNPFDFDKLIPAERFFNIAKELSLEDGLTWSKDAKISSFNFYIDKMGDNVDLQIQIFLFSEWKNERMEMYYPALSINYEKITYPENELKKYFFEYQNWRESITKAYEKISSKISEEFHLQISNDNDSFTMNFRFMTGKVKEVISFTFDGKTLLCKQDDSKITILL